MGIILCQECGKVLQDSEQKTGIMQMCTCHKPEIAELQRAHRQAGEVAYQRALNASNEALQMIRRLPVRILLDARLEYMLTEDSQEPTVGDIMDWSARKVAEITKKVQDG